MNTTQDQGAALLRSILDQPADDCVRLVYADWLEEHGENDRADLIRVQCRIADLDRELLSDEDCESPDCPGCVERRGLRRREFMLITGARAWTEEIIPSLTDVWWPNVDDNTTACRVGKEGKAIIFRWARGFVAEVRCSCCDWLAHGPEIVLAQPVELVAISDARPWNAGNHRWGWAADRNDFPDVPWYVPPAIFEFLTGQMAGFVFPRRRWYPSEAEARAALSAACLAWARQHTAGAR